MHKVLLALLGIWLVLPAFADAPAKSLRPVPRPGAAIVVVAAMPDAPKISLIRPRTRPAIAVVAPVEPEKLSLVPSAARPAVRPSARPNGLTTKKQRKGLFAAIARPKAKDEKAVSRKGSVCGDPAIKGVVLAPIKGKMKGCGIAEPVSVTSVAGVALSSGATMDCGTAKALKTWVKKGLQPAFGNDVVQLQVAAHYTCRPRNNIKGNKVSEHGRGKAIDISAIVLANGKVLTVAANYNKAMRKAYKAACGIFGTTLGPGSDGYHEDHLHFDTAKHRSGSYCR